MSEQSKPPELQNATLKTADDLRTIAHSVHQQQLSQLSLPEVDTYVDVVSRVVPAGNVPGLILSGLSRLTDKSPDEDEARTDVGRMLRGVHQLLDKAVYSTFFAGPAAVIWGYQKLLQLAGKNPEAAFPEGTWQFYVNYALREDSARHTNETHGFNTALENNNVRLSKVDRITAWVLTAIHTLHNYKDMLNNEWRERVYTRILTDISDGTPHEDEYRGIYALWQENIPYRRMIDARGDETYPRYRKRKFDEFLFPYIRRLPGKQMFQWQQTIQKAKQEHLANYQKQMSIVSTLHPEQYYEQRVALDIAACFVGVVYHGCYYFFPVCHPQTRQPTSLSLIRALVAAMIVNPSDAPATDLTALARVPRANLKAVLSQLTDSLSKDLGYFQYTPVIINFDQKESQLPLSELRQAERGVGHHPLTIFDTQKTVCFDMSHIYFDGAWGAALAEIMTNEAIHWANRLRQMRRARPAKKPPLSPALHVNMQVNIEINKAAEIHAEVAAETDMVRMDFLLELRRLFKQRNDLLQLTVNDILLLYRAIHAVTYQPDMATVAQLEFLLTDDKTQAAAESALQAIRPSSHTPAVLIPVDASRQNPRDRVYPMSFEVPLKELNLLQLHAEVMATIEAYDEQGQDSTLYERFDRLQRQYLSALAGFGAVMTRAKGIANAGESASVGSIKLLAHMPSSMQHLLDQIPDRFDVLNDIIKGREVFSNVGRVADSSSLTRFITAKDDNKQKTLAWGILTDSRNTMRISLRDFRPHVALLIRAKQIHLARAMTEHYLDTYALGLNRYIIDLQRITRMSRETPEQKQAKKHDTKPLR